MSIDRRSKRSKYYDKKENRRSARAVTPSPSLSILSLYRNYRSIYDELESIVNQFPTEYHNLLEHAITVIYRYVSKKLNNRVDKYRNWDFSLHYFSDVAYQELRRVYTDLNKCEIDMIFIIQYLHSSTMNEIRTACKFLLVAFNDAKLRRLADKGYIIRKRHRRTRMTFHTTVRGKHLTQLYSKIISSMSMNFISEVQYKANQAKNTPS